MVEAKNIRSLDSIGLGSSGGGWKGSLFLAWRGSHDDKHGQSWDLIEGLETAPLEIPKTPPAPHTHTFARTPTGNTGKGKGKSKWSISLSITITIPVPDISASTRRPSSNAEEGALMRGRPQEGLMRLYLWDEWA